MSEPICMTSDCEKPARMAIVTNDSGGMKSTLYFDDRVAPKKAPRYCKDCGGDLAQGLVKTLVSDD